MPKWFKHGARYYHLFPLWNPNKEVWGKINSPEYKIKFEAIRSSSYSFITKIDVENAIFERNDFKCVLCRSCDAKEKSIKSF